MSQEKETFSYIKPEQCAQKKKKRQKLISHLHERAGFFPHSITYELDLSGRFADDIRYILWYVFNLNNVLELACASSENEHNKID